MNEMRAGLDAVRSDITRLNEKMSEQKEDLEQYKNQTTTKLDDLHTSLQSSINDIKEDLCEKVDDINEKVCNLSDFQMGLEQRISDQILDLQLPILKVMIGSLNSINEAVTAVNISLEEHKTKTFAQTSSHAEQLTLICTKMDAIGSSLAVVSASINLTAMESQVEEHSNHVSSTLALLQNKQDAIDSKLDLLDSKQDELDMKVMSVNSELEHNVLSNITNELQQAYESVREDLGQFEHNVLINITNELKTPYSGTDVCGGTGGWRRVVYLDMTDPSTNCPSGWQLTEHSKRTCGSLTTGTLTCDSAFFPIHGGAYSSVCGTIRAYQNGGTGAFWAYDGGEVKTIDGACEGPPCN